MLEALPVLQRQLNERIAARQETGAARVRRRFSAE